MRPVYVDRPPDTGPCDRCDDRPGVFYREHHVALRCDFHDGSTALPRRQPATHDIRVSGMSDRRRSSGRSDFFPSGSDLANKRRDAAALLSDLPLL